MIYHTFYKLYHFFIYRKSKGKIMYFLLNLTSLLQNILNQTFTKYCIDLLVPKILKICTDFIEKNGMVDGIYRHTGLQSNIQRLRNAFDEEKWHEIEQECYLNDVHSVSSLLKMYFRELPNPLLTFQLYHKFIVS